MITHNEIPIARDGHGSRLAHASLIGIREALIAIGRGRGGRPALGEERNGERNEAYGAQEMSVADWSELVPTDFSDEYGSPEEIFAERKGMVHRIDKDTSGVLVFAKNPGSLVNLLAQFREKQVKKQYVCLVHGKVQPESDVIRAPLGRATGKDRRRFQVRSDGRPAETIYEVLSHWPALSSANFSPTRL